MPATPSLRSALRTLERENQALRTELEHVHHNRVALADHQALTDLYQLSQVRFRTVFEHSPLGHQIIAADLTICNANPATVAMFGFTDKTELVGHKIQEFTDPDHSNDWSRLQAQLWAHQMPYFVLETRMMRQTGTSFLCQVTSVLFPDEAGEMSYTTFIDLGEQKQRELASNCK